ncbi:hypothetical protein PIB30_003102 [Stylosanthes scabra]|uniref:Uncharacterized protein n=1 Tax=Stylosanthes scabra TaxID=79078 RepID=A0ABU6Y205_9FABA|nr:hypothetical protein [Stylosanthes scabra]
MGRDRDDIRFRSPPPVVFQMYPVVTLEELKSVILRNMRLGAVGTSLLRRVAYRLPNVFPPDPFKFKIFWVDSDEHVRALFDLHRRYGSCEVMELLTEMQSLPEVVGGLSSSNGVIPCSPIHCLGLIRARYRGEQRKLRRLEVCAGVSIEKRVFAPSTRPDSGSIISQ